MTDTEIHRLIRSLEKQAPVRLIETHISWVLLTGESAFKIKKPLKLSFLDFSTLEKRKFYCGRELELNRRLAPEMYLDVVSIRREKDEFVLDGTEGKVVDYALRMKRMENSRQMNLLLEKGQVHSGHMEQLAAQLAAFHASAQVIRAPLDLEAMQKDFGDLLSVQDFVAEELGREAAVRLIEAVDLSAQILRRTESRILERHREGFTIDAHGDLHSKNIFLLDQPVIFDCIEFNDHIRQIDLLNELAFFCMDLDYYDSHELGEYFLEQYSRLHPCIFNPDDRKLFNYYKLYRANVRLKIQALQARQEIEEGESPDSLKVAEAYLLLLNRYISLLT